MAFSSAVFGFSSSLLGVLGVLTVGLLSGCGSPGKPFSPGGPNPDESTSVSVILTSTSNTFSSDFELQFLSLALTNKAGQTVTLFSGDTSPVSDFIHLNGTTEPFVTVSVPQGVYTAATATVYMARFTCVANLSPGLDDSTYEELSAPVTIDVPDPITLDTAAMGLVLNLQVAASETYGSCVPQVGSTFSIQPTFEMTAAEFGVQGTGLANGNPASLRGIVGAVGSGGSFTVNNADGPPLSVVSSSSTVYQGIGNASALVAGMQVDWIRCLVQMVRFRRRGLRWMIRIRAM
jgi:hypothetical protein